MRKGETTFLPIRFPEPMTHLLMDFWTVSITFVKYFSNLFQGLRIRESRRIVATLFPKPEKSMIELSEIRRLLADRNLSKVAEASGVPYGKVWRVMHTDTKPSYETVKALVAYLEDQQIQKAA